MKYLITLFAVATIVAGVIILINPDTIFGPLHKKLESIGLHILAVVVRVILGVALILSASQTRFPTAILVLGYISIVAAAVLGIMGRSKFKRLMSWALGLAPSFSRIGGLLAIFFGGFLLYAAL